MTAGAEPAPPSAPSGASGAERVSGGVWSIPVAVPFAPRGLTLVYLIESDDGFVLVDTGWDTADSWDDLNAGIAATGHDVADCSGVLVTHSHPDHHGLSGRVRERSDAWVAMHPAEADFVREQRRSLGNGSSLDRALALAGSAAPSADLAGAVTTIPTLSVPVLPDRLLAHDSRADVPGRTVRARWTPGHTPGHLCFHVEDARVLCTGDHVLPRITPHVGLWFTGPEVDPLGEFLASLAALRDADVDEVLPAHEHRFTDLGGRVDAILEHHRARLASVESAVTDGAVVLDDIVRALPWDVPWDDIDPLMQQAAIGEARAHLRHLRLAGRIRRVEGRTPTTYELVSA